MMMSELSGGGKMELGACSAEHVAPKDSADQKPSQENQLGSEEEKNVMETLENFHSKEEMEPECFAKQGDVGDLGCGIQGATQTSCSEILTETEKKRQHPSTGVNDGSTREPSPKRASSESLGCGPEEAAAASASFNVSFKQLPVPRVVRRSINRYSLKLNSNRRKSLPPLHVDVSELSKAISVDLPEKERMVKLLLSSFRYSACKLESSLRQIEGYDPEIFEEKVHLLSEELRLHAKKLELDGTLEKCFEDPRGDLSDPSPNALVASLKETIDRFSAENQAWEDLLQSYQKKAEEISRQLQECKIKQVPEEPFDYLGTSQAYVFQTRPDYQKIIDCQGEVFDCLDQVLDEIHQLVKVCQSYMEDAQHYLQKLTEKLASRTFHRLESSPARKLLRLPQTKAPAFQSPEG